MPKPLTRPHTKHNPALDHARYQHGPNRPSHGCATGRSRRRRTTDLDAVVFAGASAARIHGIGDLWDNYFDFITPVRRQSQRTEIRYRKRPLDLRDVTTVDGLPLLSVEATIADLVEVVGDLSLVADALRDAWRKGGLDSARLTELLEPATLTRLTELAGVEQAAAHI